MGTPDDVQAAASGSPLRQGHPLGSTRLGMWEHVCGSSVALQGSPDGCQATHIRGCPVHAHANTKELAIRRRLLEGDGVEQVEGHHAHQPFEDAVRICRLEDDASAEQGVRGRQMDGMLLGRVRPNLAHLHHDLMNRFA